MLLEGRRRSRKKKVKILAKANILEEERSCSGGDTGQELQGMPRMPGTPGTE